MLVSKTLRSCVAVLVFVPLKSAPGSKALADPLGVAASIPINRNPCTNDSANCYPGKWLAISSAESERNSQPPSYSVKGNR